MKSTQSNNQTLPTLFWEDRSIMLENLSWHRPQNDALLPETDLAEMQLFLHLDPALSVNLDRQFRQIVKPAHRKVRERRVTTAGADGIKLTTRLEDINHMLMTEHLYPPAIYLDRLLNTGYWAIKRPPRPIEMQQILVLGIMPGSLTRTPAGSFLKTCWFDFLVQLSSLLQHHQLSNSKFRWIEGDNFFRMRSQTMSVKDLPVMPQLSQTADRSAFRQLFLRALGWLPAFLDKHAAYRDILAHLRIETPQTDMKTPVSPQAAMETVAQNAAASRQKAPQMHEEWFADWLSNDELSDEERAEGSAHNPRDEIALSLDEIIARDAAEADLYQASAVAKRHHEWVYEAIKATAELEQSRGGMDAYRGLQIMLFLPETLREDAPDLLNSQTLKQSLRGLIRANTIDVGITWVPAAINPPDAWHYEGKSRLSTHWMTGETVDIKRLSGELIKIWLQDVTREVRNG